MTKAELIERHGIEWYEARKAKVRAHSRMFMRERYQNDPGYRAAHKAKKRDRYCNDVEFREILKSKRKERYQNDLEFQEACKTYAKERYQNVPEYNLNQRLKNLRSYCRPNELELIENYELAKADNFRGWVVHHRLELTLDGEYAHSVDELKRLGMYYNRPYYELIYLTISEHTKLHKAYRHNERN